MELEKEFKAEYVSELKNPFSKSNVESIRFRIDKAWSGTTQFQAWVEFKNGNTAGEQKLTADNFNNLVKRVDEFVSNL